MVLLIGISQLSKLRLEVFSQNNAFFQLRYSRVGHGGLANCKQAVEALELYALLHAD